jgi:hypothetical protein
MARAIELLFTLLQLGPIFVLSISFKPPSPELAPQARRAHSEEPESATLLS